MHVSARVVDTPISRRMRSASAFWPPVKAAMGPHLRRGGLGEGHFHGSDRQDGAHRSVDVAGARLGRGLWNLDADAHEATSEAMGRSRRVIPASVFGMA